ncbi:MAG: type II toxin-antitoxin system VapC family toxin, partial [Sciscionella sp.]|nr:type II toxin-antitoxin system VapC family toxin [Sciscionella sp.]
MIYLDSSALVKRALVEAETVSLREWLGVKAPKVLYSSSLARVEVVRAVRARDEVAVTKARAVIDDLELVEMTDTLLDDAANLPYRLRSLDAIHLASALRLGEELDAFVAYDKRLLAAAEQAGLRAESP